MYEYKIHTTSACSLRKCKKYTSNDRNIKKYKFFPFPHIRQYTLECINLSATPKTRIFKKKDLREDLKEKEKKKGLERKPRVRGSFFTQK